VKRLWRRHGLTIVMFAVFLACWAGQYVTGYLDYNRDRREMHEAPISFWQYGGTGEFGEATAENWEAEFLSKGMLLLMTAAIFQRDVTESPTPEAPAQPSKVDVAPPKRRVRRLVTDNSLAIIMIGLFLLCFMLHAYTGARNFSEERAAQGLEVETPLQYLEQPRFWFEAFQNWQSEFLIVGITSLLSVLMRKRDEPLPQPSPTPQEEPVPK
jgi:cbb3-type cytochrome oxidase subunit 3